MSTLGLDQGGIINTGDFCVKWKWYCKLKLLWTAVPSSVPSAGPTGGPMIDSTRGSVGKLHSPDPIVDSKIDYRAHMWHTLHDINTIFFTRDEP